MDPAELGADWIWRETERRVKDDPCVSSSHGYERTWTWRGQGTPKWDRIWTFGRLCDDELDFGSIELELFVTYNGSCLEANLAQALQLSRDIWERSGSLQFMNDGSRWRWGPWSGGESPRWDRIARAAPTEVLSTSTLQHLLSPKTYKKQDFCHCLSLAFHLTSRRKFNKGLNRFHIYTCNFRTHIFYQLRRKKGVQTTACTRLHEALKLHVGKLLPWWAGLCQTLGPPWRFGMFLLLTPWHQISSLHRMSCDFPTQ